MRISVRCGKCGEPIVDSEEAFSLFVDFMEKKIEYFCPHKRCRHHNIMDFGDWKDKQKKSPLPPTRVM